MTSKVVAELMFLMMLSEGGGAVDITGSIITEDNEVILTEDSAPLKTE